MVATKVEILQYRDTFNELGWPGRVGNWICVSNLSREKRSPSFVSNVRTRAQEGKWHMEILEF
jgi:hypothetical protein